MEGVAASLATALDKYIFGWRSVEIADLRFAHLDTARLAVLVFLALTLLGFLRRASTRSAARRRVALPSVLPFVERSFLAVTRHGALVPFVVGMGFLCIAVADPYTGIVRRELSYPGRRIAMLLDASSSMMTPFSSSSQIVAGGMAFTANVSAAEYFIKLRMKGRYRDLIALVEFGDEAYVITPFTNDYDNILLNVSLIGDVDEFREFPDKGTIIAQAIEQGVDLFGAFDFLKASGNAMIIFSDGQDTQVMVHGRSVSDILQSATQAHIPVYFIRTSYNKAAGDVVPDEIWKPAVELTGGRFYAGSSEQAIVDAIHDIDRLAGGQIEIKEYSVQQPRFSPYAAAAFSFWALALALRLVFPWFRRFP
jgi:hypothetical protein